MSDTKGVLGIFCPKRQAAQRNQTLASLSLLHLLTRNLLSHQSDGYADNGFCLRVAAEDEHRAVRTGGLECVWFVLGIVFVFSVRVQFAVQRAVFFLNGQFLEILRECVRSYVVAEFGCLRRGLEAHDE